MRITVTRRVRRGPRTMAWLLLFTLLAADVVRAEECARLAADTDQHVTIGDAQRAIQRAHWVHLLNWLRQQVQHQEAFTVIARLLAAEWWLKV